MAEEKDRSEKSDRLFKLIFWALQGLWALVMALGGVLYNQASARVTETEKDLLALRIQYSAHEAADKVRLESYAQQFSTLQRSVDEVKQNLKELLSRMDVKAAK